MIHFDYVLALVLLTAPPEAPVPDNVAALFPVVQPALQALAIQWEILDQREVRYILSRPEDFKADLDLLRHRYRDLDGAPPLEDSLRFPDRETAGDLLAFNRAYRQHLGNRQTLELSHRGALRTAVQETEFLYQVWDTVRDARCEYYYVTVRRQALKKLRQLLGDDAYYSGQLPPAVPLRHFQEVE